MRTQAEWNEKHQAKLEKESPQHMCVSRGWMIHNASTLDLLSPRVGLFANCLLVRRSIGLQRCIALYCIAMQCIALHGIALHVIALRCSAFSSIAFLWIACHCFALNGTALQRCIGALHRCNAFPHCNAAVRCRTLQFCFALHCLVSQGI